MTSTEVSADLIEWAALARYDYKVIGDSVRFSTPGGGICVYIRPSDLDEDWITVSESERGGSEENYIFSAGTLATVEKYFWVDFGFEIRMGRGLPRLIFPVEPGQISPGYFVAAVGADTLELRDSYLNAVARAPDGLTGRSLLLKVSNFLDYSPEELRASYLDPKGHPIFPRNKAT